MAAAHAVSAMKKLIFAIVLILIVGSIGYLESKKPHRADKPAAPTDGQPTSLQTQIPVSSPSAAPASPRRVDEKAKKYTRAPELAGISGYLNTPLTSSGQATSVTLKSLVGKKVVIVDFWTYSCINCQRTTPYLNAWYQKYRDQGLEIVGVHTPEFEFEKKPENVARALEKFGIKYPVVQDNDYATWTAYGNRYWPHKYLVDIDGFVVYDHIGEGGYDETERTIQELLTERMKILGMSGAISKEVAQPRGVTDATGVGSPEVYFGASRNTLLANGVSGKRGPQRFIYTDAKKNQLTLAGTWNIEDEYAESLPTVTDGTVVGEAKVVFRYVAKDVYMVASGADPKKPIAVKVYRDGTLVNELKVAGSDAATGIVSVSEERLYHLIHEPAGASEHVMEFEIDSPGIRIYTFTFG